MHEVPDTGGAEADLGKIARGGGDDGATVGGDGCEEFAGAGEPDDVGDFFEFCLEHPTVFFEMDFRSFVGKKIFDGGKAGAAVGEGGDGDGVHIVVRRPAGPDAGDGGGGINEYAVHVNQQTTANDAGHRRKIVA
jgi:hypothetical protein